VGPGGGSPRGFSLVELLIVVILLGIIAAISIPLVFGYRGQADETSLRSDLAALRGAIEMFAADHDGAYPASIGDGTHAAGSADAFVWHLTRYSNAAGQTSESKDAAYPFGPYVQGEVPKVTVGPLAGGNSVLIVSSSGDLSGDANPAKAWKYSTVTGQIICNCLDVAQDGSTRYDQF
jgi:prepilin-type N-terminal cleavage/methylation domain-containing protein